MPPVGSEPPAEDAPLDDVVEVEPPPFTGVPVVDGAFLASWHATATSKTTRPDNARPSMTSIVAHLARPAQALLAGPSARVR